MTPQLVARLTAPVAILSLLLLVTALGSAWYIHHLQRTATEVMMNHIESVQAAQELEISIREISTQFNRYLITLDRKHLEPVPRMRERTADALARAERAAKTPQEQALMKRLRQGYAHFFRQYDSILEKPTQGLYPKIIELTDSVLLKEILEPAHEYSRLNEGMLTRTTEEYRELSDRLMTWLVALGVCGALGGGLGGMVLAVTIRRSLLKAEQQIQMTAAQLDEAAHRGRLVAVSTETPTDPVARMTVSASAVLQRLKQTERDALRAEQLAWAGQMAAGIAHEIRNPLMAIKVLIQAAAERRKGPGFRPKDLQVLEEEIVRLEQIVSGFLDFARPARPEFRPVDLKELSDRTLDGVKARAELQGVEIKIEPPDDPTVVSADPNQLRQVLYNLVFNALDAQPQGGHIWVRFSKQITTDGYPELVLRFEDAGPGLPAELGDRIFEPFVSTKESGLGLGLSICRRIAESHAGSLTAEPLASGGTAFVLRLPVFHEPSPPQLAEGSAAGGSRA